jgi:hypothetical protein
MDFPGEKLKIKLWETLIEKGVGSLLKPWHEKRLARAANEIRRDEVLMLAQTEIDVANIKSGKAFYNQSGKVEMLPSPERDVSSVVAKEELFTGDKFLLNATAIEKSEIIRKEVNVAKAIMVAEDTLVDDSDVVPDKKIEDDWLFAWRDYAGRVSSKEVQDLWGRILAGEVKNPGSYSMRTMEFLKNLSKIEADLICRLAHFVIDGRIIRGKETILESTGISFENLLFLQDIGVLSGVNAIGLQTTYQSLEKGKFLKGLICTNRVILVTDKDPEKILELNVYLLTKVGQEVLKLTGVFVNEEYLISVAKDIVTKGFQVGIGDWKDEKPGVGRCSNVENVSI